MKYTKQPTIRFTQRAYQKMWALTDTCDIEVSSLGVTATPEQKQADNIEEDFYILDFYVVHQDCHSTITKMREGDILDLDVKLREDGILSNQCYRNVWHHSHVNMSTGPSGTDENQVERFSSDAGLVTLITNKRGEIYARVDTFTPVRQTFEKCAIVVDTISIISDSWAKDMVEEYVHPFQVKPQKVSVKKYPVHAKKYPVHTTPVNRKTSTFPDYTSEWMQGYQWDGFANTEQNDPEGPSEEVAYEIPLLDFPNQKLQSMYEEGVITPNEAVRFFGKLKSKDLTTEDLEEELDKLLEAEFSFSDEEQSTAWKALQVKKEESK